MTVRIVLIRHGETAWNRLHRIQGRIDIPLSPTGLAQAERLAARLVREASEGQRFDALFSSDLSRAVQTALPIERELGLPMTQLSALRERSFGSAEGLDAAQMERADPVEYALWQSREPAFTFAGGESLDTFYARVDAVITELIARYAGKRIALVTHGGVLDCCYRRATGMALAAPRTFSILNASLNEVAFGSGQARIFDWGDVRHLADLNAEDDASVARACADPSVP